MKSAIDQYQMMRERQLIFGYRGAMSNELITSILQLIETKLKEMHLPFKKKKAIINILIECLQNILYHSDKSAVDLDVSSPCIFLIGKREGEFFIQIGNFIQNGLVKELKAKLEYLNSLDAEALHNLYMEVLDNGQISEKGGAGLGILRVIKDSGNQIAFDFMNIESNKVFFSMEIKISG
jgi:hypothetical protein